MGGEDEGIDKNRVISEVESSGAPAPPAPAPPPPPRRASSRTLPVVPTRARASSVVPLLVTALVGVVWLVVGVASRRFVPFLLSAFFLLVAAGLRRKGDPSTPAAYPRGAAASAPSAGSGQVR